MNEALANAEHAFNQDVKALQASAHDTVLAAIGSGNNLDGTLAVPGQAGNAAFERALGESLANGVGMEQALVPPWTGCP